MSSFFQVAPVPFGSLAFWSLFLKTPFRINSQIRFEKSSLMNRIILNNQGKPLMISIPIVGGRNVKLPLNECMIIDESWKKNLTRGIISIYQNSPYYEYFGMDILKFIHNFQSKNLHEFNINSLVLIQQLIPEMPSITSMINSTTVPNNPTLNLKSLSKSFSIDFSYYNSPIGWNVNDYNDLSILDLLFNDAPHMLNLLQY